MRNLTGALVFSTTLLLAVGCHKNTGESPDAATDSGSTRGELQAGRDAASPDAAQTGMASADSGTGTRSGSSAEPRASRDAGAGGGDRQALEACVDRWLKAQKLDRYGSPEGTMYAGGTPLFDERTGETRDRLEFVFERQPEAKKACASPDAGK